MDHRILGSSASGHAAQAVSGAEKLRNGSGIAHCAGQTWPAPPANLHLIEVGDGREAGAGMMIIEKMLPRALGRKLAVVSNRAQP
jgi:hypothetical protein